MTDTHPFSKLGGVEQLWNVTLLPLPSPRATKAVENLDVRATDARRDGKIVTLLASFESQPKAVGW